MADFTQRVTRLVTFQGIPIDSEIQTLGWAVQNGDFKYGQFVVL